MDNNLATLLRGIPVLSTMNFAEWLEELVEAARFLDCHRVLLGYDSEPYRQYRTTVVVDDLGLTRVYPAGAKAGDHSAHGLINDSMSWWQQWAAREGKARYLVLHTIEPFHRKAVRDLCSAHDMVKKLSDTFTKPIKGPDVREDSALAKLKLPESPTTEQMHAHLEEFRKLATLAKDANEITNAEELVQTFIYTLSQPRAFHLDIYRRSLSGKQVMWDKLKAEYLSIAEDPSALDVSR